MSENNIILRISKDGSTRSEPNEKDNGPKENWEWFNNLKRDTKQCKLS
jgi:hypothetical protein